MPSKKKKGGDGVSKKAEQKKKQQIIADKTFGLKNKNKSKKVQQQVEGIRKNVMNSGDRRQRQEEEKRKQQKAANKARKKAEKDEMAALFGDALMAIKKKNTTNQKDGKLEAKGRDGDDATAKKGTSRAMKMMYQMDAKEMEDRLREDPNYVPTIEDRIESERQKKVEELKKSGKGTKVTPETFAEWQEAKKKKRAEAAKKLVETELRKKKGGKGLAVLSGRDLYEYKQDLFNIADDSPAAAASASTDATEENQTEENNDTTTTAAAPDTNVDDVAAKVQSDLFLEGGDDDLDDLDDLDDD